MSWIVDLAGKAENILNKIDLEAASVLTKERERRNSGFSHQKPTGFIDHKRSSSYSLPSSSSVPANLSHVGTSSNQSSLGNIQGSGSLTSSPKKKGRKMIEKEQSLIDFLNDSKKDIPEDTNKITQGNESAQSNASHVVDNVGHSRHSSVSSGSSYLAVSGRETPGFSTVEIDTNSGGSLSSDAYVNLEAPPDPSLSISSSSYQSNDSHPNNGKEPSHRQSDVVLLRKEVSSLNQEMMQVLKRAKEAEKESQKYKDQLATLTLQQRQSEALLRDLQERETELQERLKSKDDTMRALAQKFEDSSARLKDREKTCKELQDQNQRLLQGADMSNNMHSEVVRSLQEKLKEVEESLSKERDKFTLTDKQLNDRISQLEEDQKMLSKDLLDAQRKAQDDRQRASNLDNQIAALKSELSSAREELQDYKVKAGRILQSKDLLIASLKDGTGGAGEDVYNEELEQLRGERDLLREELEKGGEKMKRLTEQIAQTEALAQHEAREAIQKMTQLQDDLAKEQSEATILQEELRQSKQDMRCLQEELTRQKVNLSTRLQERDSEIQRLQKQIAHKQSSSSSLSELENRIHGLTESLIHKQTTIESLSTDKHTLQIQLERLQQQYSESQQMLNKDPVIDFSQDEVRNRVPSFLLESPFDGGVTRRVKKAYGTLDKFSVRLGVFLRRYPIARVFVLLYMGLLHAWVMIVLLTYKPEIHGADFVHPHPAAFGGTAPRGPSGD